MPSRASGAVLSMKFRPRFPAIKSGRPSWLKSPAARLHHHPRDGGLADPAFQGFGRATVDAQGRWRFRTLRPVAYSGRTPHIHAKVKLGTRELLTTQLYVQDDPGNARDGLWRRLSVEDRAAITSPYVVGTDGLTARYELVIAA